MSVEASDIQPDWTEAAAAPSAAEWGLEGRARGAGRVNERRNLSTGATMTCNKSKNNPKIKIY